MSATVPKIPLSAGLRAARANLIPGLIIQASMLLIVFAYYRHPPTARLLGHLAELKARYGYVFSVAIAVFAGAFLPEIIRVLLGQKGRVTAENVRNLKFTIPFWIANGLFVDLLYRMQTVWFGSNLNFQTVATKVVVDVFLYNPLLATPFCAIAYAWRERHYGSFAGLFTPQFYAARVIPLLLATWGVWIPVVCVIYSLPPLLQIPLFGLALSFWSLLLSFMNPEPPTPLTAA